MHRIDSPHAVGGLWSEGTPPLVPATETTDDWFNDLQENICEAIEGTTPPTTLVKGTHTQLKTAIQAFVTEGITALKAAANTWTNTNEFQKGATFTQSTANTRALSATGNGSGAGIEAAGGATGNGISAVPGGTSGNAVHCDASASSAGRALRLTGNAAIAPLKLDGQSAPSTKEAGAAYSDNVGRLFGSNGTVWYPIGSNTTDFSTVNAGNIGLTETLFDALTIPANRLLATPFIKLEAHGEIQNTANAKTLRIYIGGAVVLSCAMPINIGGCWWLEGRIVRTGTNTQDVMLRVVLDNGASTVPGGTWGYCGTMALTETASIEFKTTGQDVADNVITQTMMAIEYP